MSLPGSDTRAAISPTPTPDNSGLVQACAEAVEELKAARKLINSYTALNDRRDELDRIQREIEDKQTHLSTLKDSEIAELNKALGEKDRAIAALEAEVAVLKKQRFTFWKGVKYFAIGAAAGVIGGVVLTRK